MKNMNYYIITGLLIIALGGLIGGYLIHKGTSIETSKDKEDIKSQIDKRHDISTIDEEANQNRPEFIFSTTNNKENNEIHIKIENKNDIISELSIDYPIWGIVSDIIDYNSTVDADTKNLLVTGHDNKNALNNIEITIAKIKPNTIIEYRVKYDKNDFEPQDLDLHFSYFNDFINKYKLSFTWEYKGKTYSDYEWRFMDNDRVTTKPPNEWKGVHITEVIEEPPSVEEEKQIPRRSFLPDK
jgi:hypothetical protein